jgi:UDP-N-acetylmuramate dehydrogenase
MRDREELVNSLKQAFPDAELVLDADMSRYTSFRTGGSAALLLDAGSREEIAVACGQASRLGIPFYVIGNGTNLLVSDRGLDALVIRIAEGLNAMQACGNSFEAESGMLLAAFAKMTVEKGYMGLEWAAGIPGTVGGAVAMNAGAYGGEISSVLKEVVVYENEEIRRVAVRPGDMGYRRSAFRAPEQIVLSARFTLEKDDGRAMLRMKEYSRARREKQPLNYPSAGSTFKRPEGHFAGRLIEEAGLKGVSIGGAQVSELHAGFLINVGNATSADVYALIRLVQQRVLETSGVRLETEVLLLGDFN